MPNPMDDNPCRVRSVKNHIGIWPDHGAADIVLVSDAPGIRVSCEQINDGLKSPLDIGGARGERPST
jgi:hypothetical protein